MGLVSGYHQSLERSVKTEIIFDKIKDFKNAVNLKDYFEFEYIRSYTPETTYDAYLNSKLRSYSENLFREISINSAPSEVIANKHFQSIVSLGETAIPHILNSLKRNPSILVWALNQILKTKISTKPLSISEASIEWIKWGKKNLFA